MKGEERPILRQEIILYSSLVDLKCWLCGGVIPAGERCWRVQGSYHTFFEHCNCVEHESYLTADVDHSPKHHES